MIKLLRKVLGGTRPGVIAHSGHRVQAEMKRCGTVVIAYQLSN
jgi:hypothetical protein